MEETSLMSASGPDNNESGGQTRLAKFLCSFGGSILPRPLDGQLRYVGGETRIITVPCNISFSNLLQRMREIFEGADIIKYQQPYEDLDALVSVVNDHDVINLMDEYVKLTSESDTPTRLRIFLFSQNALEGEALNSPPTIYDAFSERESEQRYLDALNCMTDSRSGLNTPDIEGHASDSISLRHLNVPRQSPYGPNFSDVESPYNETSHFSPRLHNQQPYELFRDVPFGVEDFNEKSGYPGNFSRGDHLNDANGTYCEHCMHPQYHQKSGCLTPDARYLDLPHRYYKGYEHNGFNNQCNDNYRNNLESSDYYNYYHHDTNGNDRMRVPYSQVNYCYDDPRINRAPEPYTPDGSRVNYLYPHGNVHDLHDNARLYNLPLATDVGTNNIPNTTQQGYNLDSLYQVPQNVPPIPSLVHKTQVHVLASASPTPYESPNAVSVNPAFVRVNQDGTTNGSTNPVYVGSPNGGINPVFVRSALNGISNDIGMNPTVKATSNGTPNGFFVKNNPDLSSNSRIKPTFMIGTPEDSPRLSGASPIERVGNHFVGSSENLLNIPVPDICMGMPDYGQLPGSRLNPNFAIQENGQCQMIIPVMGPPIAGTVVAGTPIIETPVPATSVNETPASEILVAENPPITVPDETSQKVNAPSFEIPPMKAVDKSLFELHNMAAHVEEKSNDEDHVVQNQNVLMVGGSPLKHLAESIKSMTLEGVEVIGTKEMGNDEEINLNEVTSENESIDVEQSSKSDGVSRIESTTAEQEALSKGLQTIKNEDLEEIRELGHGTYGSVYHGKWRGSDVAIKRIKASCFTGNPSERNKLIADFWKEAQILSSLHHPNVVSFYGVVRDGPDGGLATVTEFMVNGSLKQFLHKKDRTIDRRKRIILAMDAAFGMEYLHSKNIVHFDLKCENLLVNMKDAQRPICKIGDLGLSKVKRHTMVSGGIRGTLPWMAPELLNGKNDMVSDKVDVYSFGICLWELLTGEEPYAEMKAHSIIGGILHDSLRPQIPSWCDPEWKALMMSCWSTDPNERPSFSEISQKLRKMAPK